ncbi:hypothetical protein OsI_15355 [Oryza sativa Indica Group]|uniref:Uncharacterized protein n=2 Tax=Oryza sativa TaxID=4530 RepID=A3ASB1_ORYSJ|nr:hypothetical protein OsI_15355 [Oryza sativa Indica Group]EAZ30200.1 hypothetical protein OsJ_14257 [Oryza sativa Japonica Group]
MGTQDRNGAALPFHGTGSPAGWLCDTASLPQPRRAVAWSRINQGTASGADGQEQGGCAAMMRGTEPVTQRRVAGPPSSEAMRGGAARLSCATAGPTEWKSGTASIPYPHYAEEELDNSRI